MLNIFYIFATMLWAIIAVLCLIFAWRLTFTEKFWLIAFIVITLISVLINFTLPIILGTSEASYQVLRFYFSNISPAIFTGSLVLLLLFALKFKTYDAFTSNSIVRSISDVKGVTQNTSHLPPIWLLITTALATVICIIHNVDGSLLRSIVFSVVKPSAGYGASNYASQLSAMSILANIVGALYIITALLWMISIAYVAFRLIKYRNK